MNNKLYKIGFYILLLINITVVVFFLIKPDGPIHEGMKERMAKELQLTEKQKAQFEVMVQKHRNAIRKLSKEERDLTKSYFSQLKGLKVRSDSSLIFIDKITAVKAKKLDITYQHLSDTRSLCNESQQEKFDEVLDQIIPRLTGTHDRPKRIR